MLTARASIMWAAAFCAELGSLESKSSRITYSLARARGATLGAWSHPRAGSIRSHLFPATS